MRKKLLLFIGLGFLLLLTGCWGSDDVADIPLGADGEELPTITMLRPDLSHTRPPASELWMWQRYEEMTGVHVIWEEVTDFNEIRSLVLSRDVLPDVFFQTGWNAIEIQQHGSEGLFAPIDHLIEEHAPNLHRLLEENPIIRRALTMPDGHIYSIPYISMDPMAGGRTFRTYINQRWLDNLGLDMPQTTEEFAEALIAFVNDDPNGNGIADEHGWFMESGWFINILEEKLMGSYGIGNTGRHGIAQRMFVDDNDEVQLTITSDEMREIWIYMNLLFEKGAIHPEAFAGIDSDRWRAEISESDILGAWTWVSPEFAGPTIEASGDFVPIPFLEGPNGHTVLHTEPPIMGISSFIITTHAEDPAMILEWVDFFFSEEGSIFGFLGEEGVTFKIDENGNMVYVDEILNHVNGPQIGSFQWLDFVWGGNFPFAELPQYVIETARGLTPIVFDNIDDDLLPEFFVTNMPATPEEADEIFILNADIENYITQARMAFITGEWDIHNDADWNSYLDQLERMGSDRLLEIRRAQFERFMQN